MKDFTSHLVRKKEYIDSVVSRLESIGIEVEYCEGFSDMPYSFYKATTSMIRDKSAGAESFFCDDTLDGLMEKADIFLMGYDYKKLQTGRKGKK